MSSPSSVGAPGPSTVRGGNPWRQVPEASRVSGPPVLFFSSTSQVTTSTPSSCAWEMPRSWIRTPLSYSKLRFAGTSRYATTITAITRRASTLTVPRRTHVRTAPSSLVPGAVGGLGSARTRGHPRPEENLLFARDEALVPVRPAPPACAVCAVPSRPASHHQPKQSKDAVLRVLDARNRLKPSPGHLNSYEESRSVVRRPFGPDTKRRGAECEVSLDTFFDRQD